MTTKNTSNIRIVSNNSCVTDEAACASQFMLINVLIFISSLLLVKCDSFQIPDQQAMVGRLFYYRLPFTSSQLSDIKSIRVEDTEGGQLPNWMYMKREGDKVELIGVPQIKQIGIHFFHVKVVTSNDVRLEDVFNIDVCIETVSDSSHFETNRQCVLRLAPHFTSIANLWSVVSYLMPSKLQQAIDIEIQFAAFNDHIDAEDANTLIQKWSKGLFVITESLDGESFHYELKIENQQCSKKGDKHNEDVDIESRLRKLGIEFNLIRVVRSTHFNEIDEQIAGVMKFSATRSGYFDHESIGYPMRHAKRHAAQSIKATLSLSPDWLNGKTVSPFPGSDDDSDGSGGGPGNFEPLPRIIPSMESPRFSGPHELVTASLPNSPSESPRSFTNIYGTATLQPEPPTDFWEMVTPTSPLSMLSPIFVQPSSVLGSPVVIEPTAVDTDGPIFPTPVDELTTPVVSQEPKVTPSSVPGPRGLNKPMLVKHIPKLSLTAGKAWHYTIPENVFSDPEDGGTRNLTLGFFLKDRDHPHPDYWIQFDHINQQLFALPTEDNGGRKAYHFLLDAADSNGNVLTENVSVIVRQHTKSRNFHFTITFKSVCFVKYLVNTLIKAIMDLISKTADHIGYNRKAFVVTSIIREPNTDRTCVTLTWTLDSFDSYPCPKAEINKMFITLADGKLSGNEENALTMRINSDFKKSLPPWISIDGGVSLSLSGNCVDKKTNAGQAGKPPVVRNPIDFLSFKCGEIFRYKIPTTIFWHQPTSSNTYDLDLSLYTGDNEALSPDGFIHFNSSTFEMSGLAVGNQCVDNGKEREKDFKLVAKERATGLDVFDSFVIKIEKSQYADDYAFELRMGVVPEMNELDLEAKLELSNTIAFSLFGDSSTDFINVLRVERYTFSYDSSRDNEINDGNELRDDPQAGNSFFNGSQLRREGWFDESFNIASLKKKRRIKRDTIDSSTYLFEFVWTNISEVMLAREGAFCKSENIQRGIEDRLFTSQVDFNLFDKKFSDKFKVIYVELEAIGRCKNYFTPNQKYRDNMKPTLKRVPTKENFGGDGDDSYGGGQDSNNDIDRINDKNNEMVYGVHHKVGEKNLNEYLTSTLLPAVISIFVMLIVSCILVAVLIKYRRGQDKTRFEVITTQRYAGAMGSSSLGHGGDGYGTEHDSFLPKVGKPVIFESERHMMLSQPQVWHGMHDRQMHPQQHHQQQMHMRQLNQPNQILNMPGSSNLRRQPPPYR